MNITRKSSGPRTPTLTNRARWKNAVPSARCLGAATMALLVVFPLLLAAMDHHTAERIPGHQHSVPLGEPAPSHDHEFGSAHEHSARVVIDALAVPVIITQSAAIAVLSVIQNLALPILLMIAGYQVSGRVRRQTAGVLSDQVAIAPPTLPPALPAAI